MTGDDLVARPAGGRVVDVPELSLVVLIGASGSGKSTFARTHFAATEVLSSDSCRALVSDDENDQSASRDAFEVLHFIAAKRLAAGRLTVVDATNVQPESRRELIALAREHDVLPVAIVLDLPEAVCVARNAERADRRFGPHVQRRQRDQLRRGLRGLSARRLPPGARAAHASPRSAPRLVTRTRLFSDLKDQTGPFDVIGDVHGCLAELEALLGALGYVVAADEAGRAGRRPAPAGAARGLPRRPGRPRARLPRACCAWRWAWSPPATRCACPATTRTSCCRALRGRKVQISHGLAESLAPARG